MSRLSKVTAETTLDLENFRFAEATKRLRDFTWNDFCDCTSSSSKTASATPTPDRSPSGCWPGSSTASAGSSTRSSRS